MVDGTDGGRPTRDTTGAAEAVYVISVAAELAGMHPQTLRAYERNGLLTPKRSSGNVRRYSDQDIARLQQIAELTEQGLNLSGVKMVLELREALTAASRRASRLERELRDLMDRLRDEVAAAHRSHRFEIVPVERVALEPYRRRRPSAPLTTTDTETTR